MVAGTPPSAKLQRDLAEIDRLLAARQLDPALKRLSRLLKKHPDQPGLLFIAARAAVEAERLDRAAAWLRRLEQAPLPPVDVAIEVTQLQRRCGLADRAASYLERVARANPGHFNVLLARADAARATGRTERARALYLEALERDPACEGSLLFLARDPNTDPATVLSKIEKAVDDSPTSGLLFALGSCRDRLGEHRDAFRALERANQLARSSASVLALDRKIAAAPGFVREFSAGTMKSADSGGHPSDKPVFVVGMPRSGTTLTEQIIAAHPRAAGVGERQLIGRVLARHLERMAPGETLFGSLTTGRIRQDLGHRYLAGVEQLVGRRPRRIVDKMPFNFALLGPACLMFPRATVIEVTRDPHDVCWSMYSTGFQAEALRLSLREIGLLSALYEFLMAHWREVCPVEQLSYEDLVGNFDVEAPRLVGKTGLPWDEACARFYQAKGNEVRTASADQVRRPIYANSVGRSRPYRAWMTDFDEARRETLEALAGEITGSDA